MSQVESGLARTSSRSAAGPERPSRWRLARRALSSEGWAGSIRDYAVSFAILLALWWIVAALTSPLFLPTPPRVAESFLQLYAEGQLLPALWATVVPLFGGLVAACLVGSVGGLVMGLIPPLDRVTGPWVYVFWSTPVVALLPLIVTLVGVGVAAAILFVFLSSVFPVIMNARSGAKNTDRDMIEVARSLGASQRQILWQVVLPASIPPIVSGFRIAVGRAVVAVIVAQLFLSATGIGYMIRFFGDTLQLHFYFAPLILTVFLGVTLNGLADLGERKIIRWEARAD